MSVSPLPNSLPFFLSFFLTYFDTVHSTHTELLNFTTSCGQNRLAIKQSAFASEAQGGTSSNLNNGLAKERGAGLYVISLDPDRLYLHALSGQIILDGIPEHEFAQPHI